MKTILHIIDTTGPGGAETVFIDLATMLPKDKYRSIVVIRGIGWVYEELCRRGMSPIILDAKGSFNWRYLLSLCKLIKSENVQLIQTHLLGSNIYGSIAGLLTRTPVVATFHGAVDVDDNERLKWLKFAAINLGANRIIAVSKNLRDNIIKRTPIKASKVEVVYNGIDTEKFNLPKSTRLRSEFNFDKDDILVGSLGNIRPAKAYDFLLHAASLLKNKEYKFKFLIAGQGENKLSEELLELRTELKLEDSVKFIGFTDKPAEFLSNLDVFLLTSSSEGFSIATIQAMAACKPVIATRSGGPEEIIELGKTGTLVAVNDINGITNELAKMAEDKHKSNQIAIQGMNHVVNTFDIEMMLSSYQKIFDSL